LTNAGFLTVEDLDSAHTLELAMIPRIGAKSLALLCELKGEKLPDVEKLHRKAKRFHSFLSPKPVRSSAQVVHPVGIRFAPLKGLRKPA
jgi:hypothetical protein